MHNLGHFRPVQQITIPPFAAFFQSPDRLQSGPDGAALEKYSPESSGTFALRLRVHLQVKG